MGIGKDIASIAIKTAVSQPVRNEMTRRDIESDIRDYGYSKAEAKEMSKDIMQYAKETGDSLYTTRTDALVDVLRDPTTYS